MRSRHQTTTASLLAAIGVFGSIAGCGGSDKQADPPTKGQVKFNILQLSDLYELGPIDQGHSGGLARVAGLRNKLKDENENTLTVLCGDLLSPSPMGRVAYEDGPIAGRQMIDVINGLGLDYATFGNHDFDLDRGQLLARLRESTAKWVSSNTTDYKATPKGNPFALAPKWQLRTLVGAKPGQEITVALIGLTTNKNLINGGYVSIDDPVKSAHDAIADLRKTGKRYDLLIALTHLTLEDDRRLAEECHKQIQLILGGHDGLALELNGTAHGVPIIKSDLNARSVWVLRCTYDIDHQKLAVHAQLRPINDEMMKDEKIAEDRQTNRKIAKWEGRFARGLKGVLKVRPWDRVGWIPEGVSLDGRGAEVRSGPTNLTRLIGQSMIRALGRKLDEGPLPKVLADKKPLPPRLAIFNSGMVRLGDRLSTGPITAYDVLRILPFPDEKIRGVTMNRDLVKRLLESRTEWQGKGNYLQVFDEEGKTPCKVENLRNAPQYLVAVNNYVIDGKERNFEGLKDDRDVVRIDSLHEIETPVKALIDDLRAHPRFDSKTGEMEDAWTAPTILIEKAEFKLTDIPVINPMGEREPVPKKPRTASVGLPPSDSVIVKLEDSLEKADGKDRLILAESLIHLDPESRLAAEAIVDEYRGRNASTRLQARRILTEVMPTSPPGLIRALRPILNPDEESHVGHDFLRKNVAHSDTKKRVDDDFLREDVLHLLSKADPKVVAQEEASDVTSVVQPVPVPTKH